ncbi:MAG TPA: hypothetical protein VFI86_07325 [Burkholderiales bacterium]|nr:hypothetical protein [Burkholderiales bacterium]
MGAWASLAVLALAGFAALHPASPLPWLYLGAVFVFEAWLFGLLRSAGSPEKSAPLRPGVPPYGFNELEARLVERYRFYFTFPGISRHAASVLAAIGLSALVLAPWLTYRMAYAPAALGALNLLPVAWLTRRVAPLLALGMAANRGNREALDLLSAHDTAWEKIRRCNIGLKESAP